MSHGCLEQILAPVLSINLFRGGDDLYLGHADLKTESLLDQSVAFYHINEVNSQRCIEVVISDVTRLDRVGVVTKSVLINT